MTVASDVQDVTYNADGSTVAFPIPFYFLRNADVRADQIDASGIATPLVLGTDFMLTGAGNPSGGGLTMTWAIATGNTLHIYRDVPATQETQYQQNDPFPAKTTEKALDKLTMLIQRAFGIIATGVRYPFSEFGMNAVLPPASKRARKALVFKSSGEVATSVQDWKEPQTILDEAKVTAEALVAGVAPGSGTGSFIQDGPFSVVRSFQDKMRDFLSPRDKGATGIGDAAHDDYSAFVNTSGTRTLADVNDGNYYLGQDVTASTTFRVAPGAVMTGPAQLYAPVDLSSVLPAANAFAAVMQKIQTGVAVTIACYGDSITYGQDTTASGVPGSQINGAGQTRSTQQWPENLRQALAWIGESPNITLYNRGFPGDTTRDGLVRWRTASATDISFIAYGHNDANNYGTTGAVSLPNYRRNLRLFALREIQKGAAVVIVGPAHVRDPQQTDNIRPYALAAKQVAHELGALFIDHSEILRSVTKLYTDGVHLTSFAYAEIGWQSAALFVKRNGDMQKVGVGDFFYPDDEIGRGRPGSIGDYGGAKGNGRLIQLDPGQYYMLGLDCVDDVIPVVHSYNTGGIRQVTSYYVGGADSTRGVPTAVLLHDASKSQRMTLPCQELQRGKRTLLLRNDGDIVVYLEAIEFVGKNHLHMSHGAMFKSEALSGARQYRRMSGILSSWWSAADYGRRLTAPYAAAAHVRLDDGVQCGLAFWKTLPIQGEVFSSNALFILRNGTTLVIRDYVNGAANDTLVSNIFPAGVWDGEIHVDVTTSSVDVYINGTYAGSRANPTNITGFAGLLADKTATMQCHCFYHQGGVKGPYFDA